jgi:hypothetical protein
MYLIQTYSSDVCEDCDDYDEEESFKTILNCITRCIRLRYQVDVDSDADVEEKRCLTNH